MAMKIILSSAWVSIQNEDCDSQCCSISNFSVYWSAPFYLCKCCCCCLSENVLIRGKIQLHYKVIKCLLQSVVTFS